MRRIYTDIPSEVNAELRVDQAPVAAADKDAGRLDGRSLGSTADKTEKSIKTTPRRCDQNGLSDG